MYLNKALDENYFLVCLFLNLTKKEFQSNLDSKGIPRTVSTKTLKKRRPASRPLGQILRTTDNNFIDFIRRCFEFVLNRI